MIPAILFLAIVVLCIYFFKRNKAVKPVEAVADIDPALLDAHVLFYNKLEPADKKLFEARIADFLQRVRITPVHTTLTQLDKLYVAAGAIIPIFRFSNSNWHYPNLVEVLVYEDHFNHDFKSSGSEGRNIMGMVGTGYMEGKMLLSKPALEAGFSNQTDKNNTVIHEFVHLIDKLDGDTDGVPQLLLEKQYVLPWLDLIQREMKKMDDGKSDINPYGLTNQSEFFAVVAEYFFERPDLMEEKHPELYKLLQVMFGTHADT